MLSWDEVSPESIQGHFRGYKIQTWVENDEKNVKEILIEPYKSKSFLHIFTPNSINYARIFAFNDKFDGPPSDTIKFETPDDVPSKVQSFEAFPLGSSAFILKWDKPLKTNGKLLGYKITYVEKAKLNLRHELRQNIVSPEMNEVKLAGLKSGTEYRITIVAFTNPGNGEE